MRITLRLLLIYVQIDSVRLTARADGAAGNVRPHAGHSLSKGRAVSFHTDKYGRHLRTLHCKIQPSEVTRGRSND
jgi:hypothetical protein